MFICNHCPYVKAIRERIVRDCKELAAHGIGAIADHVERRRPTIRRTRSRTCSGWRASSVSRFPYVLDESQAVARAYGAVCTPEFFGYNADLELQYHGRLDASKTAPVANARRELFDAMAGVARLARAPPSRRPRSGARSSGSRATGERLACAAPARRRCSFRFGPNPSCSVGRYSRANTSEVPTAANGTMMRIRGLASRPEMPHAA